MTQRRQRDTESDVSSGYYSGVSSMTSTQSGVQARREHLASGRAHLKPLSRDPRAQPSHAGSFIDFLHDFRGRFWHNLLKARTLTAL